MFKNRRQTRIAFIGYYMGGGGAERNAINIAKYLEKEGFYIDFFLMCKRNDYTDQYSYLRKKKLIYLIPFSKINPILLPFLFFYYIFKLLIFIKKRNINLLLGFSENWPTYLTAALSILTKKKSIVVITNNIREDLKNKSIISRRFHFYSSKYAYKSVSKIVCPSRGLANDVGLFFPITKNKLINIYNGFDLRSIALLSEKKLPPKYISYFKNRHLFVTMGRLVKQKNLFLLLNIFKYINKKIPNSILLIIGDGPLKKKLSIFIKTLGLKNKVILHGFERINPYNLIKNAKLFISTTSYEGFGNVMVEALAVGTPVISTSYNFGIKEIMQADKRMEKERFILLLDKNFSLKTCYLYAKELLDRKRFFNPDLSEFNINRVGAKYYSLIQSLLSAP